MSSFSATLKVNGKNYKLHSSHFSAVQMITAEGKPASRARAGEIVVSLILGDDTSLLEWMLDSYKRMDGSITYRKTNENSTLKELTFKQAFCTSYSESFAANSSEDTVVTLCFVGEDVELVGVAFNS